MSKLNIVFEGLHIPNKGFYYANDFLEMSISTSF